MEGSDLVNLRSAVVVGDGEDAGARENRKIKKKKKKKEGKKCILKFRK